MTEPAAPDAAPRWLTVEEIAAELRVSEMSVYRWVGSGDLPAVRVGRTIRVSADAYAAWLAARAVTAPPTAP